MHKIAIQMKHCLSSVLSVWVLKSRAFCTFIQCHTKMAKSPTQLNITVSPPKEIRFSGDFREMVVETLEIKNPTKDTLYFKVSIFDFSKHKVKSTFYRSKRRVRIGMWSSHTKVKSNEKAKSKSPLLYCHFCTNRITHTVTNSYFK